MESDVIAEGLIEKMTIYAQKPAENIEGLRGAVSKLYSRVSSVDKTIKRRTLDRLWEKQFGTLAILLNLIEVVRDQMTCNCLAGILHECISIKAGKQRNQAVNQLLQLNASNILIKIVNQPQIRENAISYECLITELLWVLSQLAQRDCKFSLKTRLLGAVKTFHLYLRTFYNNSKILYPSLLIIKALARNTNTATALAKDNIIITLEKVFGNVGFSPSPKLRLALNVLTHLSKNKMCCTKLAQSLCLEHILKIMERWDRYDGRMKLKLCYYSLITLQRACYMKTGRKIVKAGLVHIYKFCQNCPDERSFDSSLNRATSIINYCLDRRTLPSDLSTFPLKFPLPSVNNSSDNLYHDGSPEFDDVDSEDEAVEDGDDECVSQLQEFEIVVDKGEPMRAAPKALDDIQIYSKFLGHFFPWKHNTWEEECRTDKLKKDFFYENSTGAGDVKTQNEFFSKGKPTMRLLNNLPSDPRLAYIKIASQVNSTIPFVKIAYPDMIGAGSRGILEPLNYQDRDYFRRRLRDSVEKAFERNVEPVYKVVYDLDALCPVTERLDSISNDDPRRVGEKLPFNHLLFESRFESGNLRKAIQIGHYEYELMLNSDVNSDKHHGWFYFEVSNMLSGPQYIFNIVNCEKINSQFNYGMKPLFFSVCEATMGRSGWVRMGTNICYYRNSYRKPTNQHKCYFTATFTIEFPHDYDVCYIAYHFPYNYSQILLSQWSYKAGQSGIVFKVDPIAETLNKNQVAVVTFSSRPTESSLLSDREIIFLTGRVHPGESNSSWILHGIIEFLLGKSTQAINLRKRFIFVIVPMLNVEGVINGCSRCGLTNEDLNRRWKTPSPILHPEIYHTKGLLEFLCRGLNKPPFVFCDFHGHSRKKNMFVYGCSGSESWAEVDRLNACPPADYLLLAYLMSRLLPSFSYSSCKFRVEKSKEATARVSVWRDFGIKRSYTLESSYCGCDQGAYAGQHFDTLHLCDAGRKFCEALACLIDETTWPSETLLPPVKCSTRAESPVSNSSDGLDNSDQELDLEM